MQNYAALDRGKGFLERGALRAIAAADIDEYHIFGARILGYLGVEGNCIEPCRKHGKLGFHEAVEGALLGRMCLHPCVEVFIAVLAYFKGCLSFFRMLENLV